MIKYICTESNRDLVKFNTDTLEVGSVNYFRPEIDWMWYIEEDGKVTYKDKEYDVMKGEFFIKLYTGGVLIIKGEEWFDIISEYNARKNNNSDCCETTCKG